MVKKEAKFKECVAFGVRIKDLRTEMNLTQEKFAHKAKIHRTYLVGIETGSRNPTLTMIHQLAKALKVDASWLV